MSEHAEPKIIAVTIGPMPPPMPEAIRLLDPVPRVTATFDNGEVKTLFGFYPDEISFTEAELIGLTEKEAHALRHRKDVDYLQSS